MIGIGTRTSVCLLYVAVATVAVCMLTGCVCHRRSEVALFVVAEKLKRAIECSDETQVQRLLHESPAAVNRLDWDGEATPLYWAVAHDKVDMVELLLQLGADPNVASRKSKMSPLSLTQSESTLALLLEHGADINYRNQANGQTPIYDLLVLGHLELAVRLVRRGANVKNRDYDGWTALHYGAQDNTGEGTEFVKLLLENGADPNACDSSRQTPLHRAAIGGNAKTVELLLAYGAEKEVRDRTLRKPVDYAVAEHHDSVARLLQQ